MAEVQQTPNLQAVDAFYGSNDANEDPSNAIPEETNLSEQIDKPQGGDEYPAADDSDARRGDESPEPDLAAAEDQDSGEEPKAADEAEQAEVHSLDEFVDYLREEQGLEIDQDFLEGLEVELKVNGEMVVEKLGDVMARARQMRAADDFLEDAKQKSKSILEEARQQKEVLGENVVVLGQLIQHMESSLVREFQGTDWAQLRNEDPAEYTARKRDFEEREQQLNAMKSQASATYHDALKKAQESAQEAQERALRESLPEEREKLYGHLPEWQKDIKKAEKESAAAFKYMRDLGYSEEKIKLIVHNGTDLATAVKAMRYDQVKGRSDAEDKRVRKIPRILKSGGDSRGESKPNDKPEKRDRADILYG